MKRPPPKRPRADPRQATPSPEREAPSDVDADVIADVEQALSERHGDGLTDDESLRLEATVGLDCAWLKARIGSEDRAYEAELFARGIQGDLFEGALGVLVDYLDGLLEEWVRTDRDAWLPLDWEGRPFDDVTLFVRGDLRDYAAEQAAERLLTGNGEGPGEEA